MADVKIFQGVQHQSEPSNSFDLSHHRKSTTQFGRLTPIMCTDVLPGDKFTINTSVMMRLAPMVYPVMHKVKLFVHHWFVPNRILWENWEKFITGQGEEDEEYTPPVAPYIHWNAGSDIYAQPGSLGDHLGLPTDQGYATSDLLVNALPFAAYQHVFYEYYRDQNFLKYDKSNIMLVDGDNEAEIDTLTEMHYRAWRHDYFTSALPWVQKGPEAMLPLGETAPLKLVDDVPQTMQWLDTGLNPYTPGAQQTIIAAAGTGVASTDPALVNVVPDVTNSHEVDLSLATSSSIIELRRAMALQSFLELNARSGTRYTEYLKARWNVHPEDFRLQRPEYIGGYSQPVQISEVLQNSAPADPEGTPLGTMGGHGLSVGSGGANGYVAKEHGWFITIMSVLPSSEYFQGIPKMHFPKGRFDYYTKEFDHIGEQPIYNSEIMVTDADNGEIWGYMPRYAEYRFMMDTVHGQFRTTLDKWHMARIFATRPGLNIDFIQFDPEEVARIFALTDTSSDPLWCHIFNSLTANRKMSVYATPGLRM